MRFLLALLKALLHAIGTLGATMLVQAVSAGWMVFVMGQHDTKFGPWGTFRFLMMIAFGVALMQSGVFLVASLIAHFKRGRISGSRLALSSLTLAFSSLSIWFVAADPDGIPALFVLFGLPVASACWLIGPKAEDDVAARDGKLTILAERGGILKVRVELTSFLNHDAIRGDLEGAGFAETDERTLLQKVFSSGSVRWVTGTINAAKIEKLTALSFVKSVEGVGSMDGPGS